MKPLKEKKLKNNTKPKISLEDITKASLKIGAEITKLISGYPYLSIVSGIAIPLSIIIKSGAKEIDKKQIMKNLSDFIDIALKSDFASAKAYEYKDKN